MSLSSARSGRGPVAVAVTVSLLYPFLVYFAMRRVPPLALVAFVLAMIGVRLLTLGNEAARVWRGPLLAATAGVAALAILDGPLAAKAYPVFISFGVAFLFGRSLYCPPSLVERVARLTEPVLPAEGVAYCRTVTLVWTAFLTANGLTAAILAGWGSLEAWTLWTGLLSYLAMGVLFAGEYVARRIRRGRRGAA